MSFGPPFSLPLFGAPGPGNPQSQLTLATSKAPVSSATDTPSSSGHFPVSSLPSGLLPGPGEMSAEALRFLSAAGHPGPGFPMGGIPGHAHPSPFSPLEHYRNILPPGFPPVGLYSGFGSDGKSSESFPGPPLASPSYFYDPSLGGYPYGGGPLDLNGARRKNATRETTAALKAWLYEHRKNPYPTKGEKIMLAIITKMTLTQVSTWFANARRRLKKENKMTWSPRNRPGEEEDIGGERSTSSLSNPGTASPDILTLLKDEPSTEKDPDLSSTKASESLTPSREDEANNNGGAESPEPSSSDRKRERDPTPPQELPIPPKKPKIWSIADTVASTSSTSSSATSSTSTTVSSSKPNDSGPFHFTFNPWQQQQQHFSGLLRPPMGHPFFGSQPPTFRPELFSGRFPPQLFGFGSPPPVMAPSLSALGSSLSSEERGRGRASGGTGSPGSNGGAEESAS